MPAHKGACGVTDSRVPGESRKLIFQPLPKYPLKKLTRAGGHLTGGRERVCVLDECFVVEEGLDHSVCEVDKQLAAHFRSVRSVLHGVRCIECCARVVLCIAIVLCESVMFRLHMIRSNASAQAHPALPEFCRCRGGAPKESF